MSANGPLTIHNDNTHTHTISQLAIIQEEYYYGDVDDNNNNDNDKIRIVNLTGVRGNRSVWWQVTTSNGLYWIYLCVSFHLRIFHYMFVRAGSLEVFRGHDIMEHIS